MERAPEIEALTRQLFEMFFETGDASIAERLVSSEDGVLVIGTDPQEWLADYATIMGTFKAQAEEISALNPESDLGEVTAYREGDVGWVSARPTVHVPDAGVMSMRAAGVFRREGSDWRLIQLHASIGVPNEEAFGQELTV